MDKFFNKFFGVTSDTKTSDTVTTILLILFALLFIVRTFIS